MSVLIIFMGLSMIAIIVISIVAIIMSTSDGANWSSSVWKSLDEGGRNPTKPQAPTASHPRSDRENTTSADQTSPRSNQ